MSYTIRFSPNALADYSEAYEWYEDKNEGVEKKFERAVLDRLKFIALYPEASAFKYQYLRGTRLKKFPYRLFFELNETRKMASIVAILHDARDNALLSQRFG
jgi:plasmid stabilization system protein ParE